MTCATLLCLMNMMGSNVYVTGELQSQIQKPKMEGRWCGNQGHWCRGPLGVFRLGTRVDLTDSFTLDLGLSHTSYVSTNTDRGEESAYMSLTWRPFKN